MGLCLGTKQKLIKLGWTVRQIKSQEVLNEEANNFIEIYVIPVQPIVMAKVID